MIAVGDLAYDPADGHLRKYGRAISIGAAPLRLLLHLMRHHDRSFGAEELASVVLGEEGTHCRSRPRAVIKSQVRRIRWAIEDDTGPWLLHDGRGYGLWLEPPITRARHLMNEPSAVR